MDTKLAYQMYQLRRYVLSCAAQVGDSVHGHIETIDTISQLLAAAAPVATAAPGAVQEPDGWIILDSVNLKPALITLDKDEIRQFSSAHVVPVFAAPIAAAAPGADERKPVAELRRVWKEGGHSEIVIMQGTSAPNLSAFPIGKAVPVYL